MARGLERDWEERLRALETAKIELERREKERPRVISQAERDRLLALGPDLAAVWNAPTTTPRDRKELLRTLIEDVTIKVDRDKAAAHLALRWKGGALNEIDLALPRSRPATVRTDEDTIALLRRLAVHYPDSVIAGVLNRQERATELRALIVRARATAMNDADPWPAPRPRLDIERDELVMA